jgi:hypothetical protein
MISPSTETRGDDVAVRGLHRVRDAVGGAQENAKKLTRIRISRRCSSK